VLPVSAAFFTRNSSYCFQRVLAIAILSACPSVCPSVTRVHQSKTVQAKITKSVARGRQTTGGYSVLLVLTTGRDLSRSANAVSTENRKKFFHNYSFIASLGLTPFEFMEKLYES